MSKFEIKEDFYLNDKKIKIVSGAIHYFRVVPEYWRDRLEKLKSMGCNCVETYIPWNYHEVKKGEFNFEGNRDFVKFIKIAESLGLYVILRPTPYICAEWEFGGLPAWLLKDDSMRVRSTYKGFLDAVDSYFEELFKHIVPLQITNGGPIIMMQVENEYGSFSNDKDYLKAIKDLMIKHGANVPLFTSDGGWKEALDAGTLVSNGVFPTANFGSRTDEQIGSLEIFMKENNIEGPLMCMEFWIGWFNNWGGEFKRRDSIDAAKELNAMLNKGHVNIYMFHGGTNFGFYNGCSYHDGIDPQTTTYDYDAPLNEWGEPSSKYFDFKDVISKFKNIEDVKLSTNIKFKDYGEIKLSNKVSLFNTLEKISKPIFNNQTLSMEKLDQNFGYILYRAKLPNMEPLAKSKLVDCDDRAQVFLNNIHVTTQYKETMGENIPLNLDSKNNNTLDILVENLGRINYGASLVSPKQRKGIKGGVMLDIHFHSGWEHYSLDMENINDVDFSLGYIENTPAFYEYTFEVSEKGDTFLHLPNFGKGCAFINGFNLGRFWNIGPTRYLYIPAPLLNLGENKIVIFETEGKYSEFINLKDKPLY
ncbi:beta-galactosidase [Clostridium baratii]|uniref:glycoside hydrolase family 35 protein n=1 Tax=Clostridium baratii TaxID=1561 RepID=UPI0028FE6084|nr:beta-galactosidase [Clostridium baratii]MDU1055053.1 beta-galactosidase [Clostridium baratii]